MVATEGKKSYLPHLKMSTVQFELHLVAHQPMLVDLTCTVWPFFLPRSKFLHLAGFRPSYKMHILLKNPSDQLCSLTLLHFQSKEQPQHPPSSSLLFPSWQNINAYIFPRTLVSLPRTCHDIIFNSVFSSLLFFMEEPWKLFFFDFFFICIHICFALSFPSSLLIKRPGPVPANCQMHGAGHEIPWLIKSPFLNSPSS